MGSHTSSYPCEMAVLQLCVRGLLALPLKKHPLSERESGHFANEYTARYETDYLRNEASIKEYS